MAITDADLEVIFVREWSATRNIQSAIRLLRQKIRAERPQRDLAPTSQYRQVRRQNVIPLLLQRFAAANGIRIDEITDRNKHRTPSRVRWEVMWCAYDLGELSYPEIAARVGNRTHQEAIRGVKIVETRIAADPGLAERLRRTAGVVSGVALGAERRAA